MDGARGQTTEVAIVAVALVAALYFIYRGAASSGSTSIAFSAPNPNSVAALASATAAENTAQTNLLGTIAQTGASVATTLSNNQTSIRTAQINANAAQNIATVEAGSNQQIAMIQAQGVDALAQITGQTQQAVANLQAGAYEKASSNNMWSSIVGSVIGGVKSILPFFSGGAAGAASTNGGFASLGDYMDSIGANSSQPNAWGI